MGKKGLYNSPIVIKVMVTNSFIIDLLISPALNALASNMKLVGCMYFSRVKQLRSFNCAYRQ